MTDFQCLQNSWHSLANQTGKASSGFFLIPGPMFFVPFPHTYKLSLCVLREGRMKTGASAFSDEIMDLLTRRGPVDAAEGYVARRIAIRDEASRAHADYEFMLAYTERFPVESHARFMRLASLFEDAKRYPQVEGFVQAARLHPDILVGEVSRFWGDTMDTPVLHLAIRLKLSPNAALSDLGDKAIQAMDAVYAASGRQNAASAIKAEYAGRVLAANSAEFSGPLSVLLMRIASDPSDMAATRELRRSLDRGRDMMLLGSLPFTAYGEAFARLSSRTVAAVLGNTSFVSYVKGLSPDGPAVSRDAFDGTAAFGTAVQALKQAWRTALDGPVPMEPALARDLLLATSNVVGAYGQDCRHGMHPMLDPHHRFDGHLPELAKAAVAAFGADWDEALGLRNIGSPSQAPLAQRFNAQVFEKTLGRYPSFSERPRDVLEVLQDGRALSAVRDDADGSPVIQQVKGVQETGTFVEAIRSFAGRLLVLVGLDRDGVTLQGRPIFTAPSPVLERDGPSMAGLGTHITP
jgi:hypothetical protein